MLHTSFSPMYVRTIIVQNFNCSAVVHNLVPLIIRGEDNGESLGVLYQIVSSDHDGHTLGGICSGHESQGLGQVAFAVFNVRRLRVS